ncbi:hypothetical protein JD844_011630 [Phrynosoma platyrhinos]|uniref:DUF4795 domain-containing protein n=1 Tax=Phrynosoma platyrhinos TaxID=52577 RepID=A0ABQ7TIE6_PHRPL|nr:hypothetical protein JD844_011630 [Phrynosoma platyrhinos]
MSVKVSLYELADLSIGTPEIGIVNFNALHALLHAILRHLNLEDIKAEMKMDRGPPSKTELVAAAVERGIGDLLSEELLPKEKESKGELLGESVDARLADLEKKMFLMGTNLQGVEDQVRGIEDQFQGVQTQVQGFQDQVQGFQDQVQGVQDHVQGVQDKVKSMGKQLKGVQQHISGLERLPSGTDLLEKSRSGSGTAVSDMWQMMQMQKKVEANEDGINQAMTLLQDLLDETNNMKSTTANLEDDIQKIKDHLALKDIERRLSQFPSPEEMSNMVRWEVLEDVLVKGKRSPSPKAEPLDLQEPSLGLIEEKERQVLKLAYQELLEPLEPSQEASLALLGPNQEHFILQPSQEFLEPRQHFQEVNLQVLGLSQGPIQEHLELKHLILGLPGLNLELPGLNLGLPGLSLGLPGLSLGLLVHKQLTLLLGLILEPNQPTLEHLEPILGAILWCLEPILGLLEPILELQVVILGQLDLILEDLGHILELQVAKQLILGYLRPILECLGLILGLKQYILEHLAFILGHPILELSLGVLEPKQPILEPSLEVLGPLGPNLEHLGPNLEHLEPNLRLLRPKQPIQGPSQVLLELTLSIPGLLGFSLENMGLGLLILEVLGLNPVLLEVKRYILELKWEFLGDSLDFLSFLPFTPDPSLDLQVSNLDILVSLPFPGRTLLDISLVNLEHHLQQANLPYHLAPLLASHPQRPQYCLPQPPFYKNIAIIPPDLPEKLAAIKSMQEDMKTEKEKLRKIQNVFEGELAGQDAEEKVEGAGQINMQIGYLRATVQDIEKELKELRDKQDAGKATLEQSVTDTAIYLQEQLDKLRSVIENMMASSSTLLSMSMPPTPEPGLAAQVQQGTCAACTLDVSEKVSQLFKRYEQLQDSINNFMLRQAEGKLTKRPKHRQDEEMLSHIQNTILQVQEDCEKLNATTGNLIEDHRQKQKEINMLFKSLEKLENEKADKDHLVMEIDVKADKAALAAKVSRTQFDATTEQLHKMMQELLNKMAGQEQDWQKMLDKLLIEMDSKLDRLELDPFRQQLEERWKDIRKQLKQRAPQDEGDEAAGIRRRLLAHFHCISCDRPLEMVVPGPHITTLPAVPGLPPHQSLRPYMVYEMEQIRQLNRNLKLGPGARFDALEKSTSLSKLRRIHSKMLMDIQKVQSHYGGAARVNAQMIREILQAQCLGSSLYGKRDRLPEMADYSYVSVPRHCGGSHTLTYPYRRIGRFQHLAHCMPPIHADETTMLAMMKHEEVDILGLDGHIYKGRMDTQLPSITGKDGTSSVFKHYNVKTTALTSCEAFASGSGILEQKSFSDCQSLWLGVIAKKKMVVVVVAGGENSLSRPRNKLIRSSSQRHHPTLADIASLPVRPHSAKVSLRSLSAKSVGDKSMPHIRINEEPRAQDRETLELRMEIPSRQRSDEQST